LVLLVLFAPTAQSGHSCTVFPNYAMERIIADTAGMYSLHLWSSCIRRVFVGSTANSETYRSGYDLSCDSFNRNVDTRNVERR